MKNYSTIYLFILLLISSCGGRDAENAGSGNKNVTKDTLNVNDGGNQYLDPPEELPRKMQELLKKGKFESSRNVDSLLIDSVSWFYNLGAGNNKFNSLLLVEDDRSGSASGGNKISVIKKNNGKYYKTQSLFAFFDKIDQTVNAGNYNIALYYTNALFDNTCPVSVTYKWNSQYYVFDGINYITSLANVNYNWNLLETMGILNKSDLIQRFPFVKENNLKARYNINNIDIDTIVSKNKTAGQLFLFKNKKNDNGIDHIWILKAAGDEYMLLNEESSADEEELTLVKDKMNNYPDIIFGKTILHWHVDKYVKKKIP